MQLPNVVLANTIPTVYLKQNYQNYKVKLVIFIVQNTKALIYI